MRIKTHSVHHLLILAAILFLSSCSSSNSPESKVEEFYKFLNAGEYAKAKELYTAEAKRILEQDIPKEEYLDWARNEETKQGQLKV